ncbi:MAG: 3'-5' exonuclease [Saprospiraceae bacterium]|jgi:DNA polymerase-3 subunit epsilon|nr:3'-5' exonuclease [Saprospiraceae bacterium]MBK7795593.1 3'-5' exonuclease [Saprospiraceae bacterium]MBK8154116.1 3'-5' exonuclease [Saprospiraceae bacterium]MBL0260704.1 3'-5' exonuclease [Saprospiraceae bacterium]MBX7163301.1 3'-5' exonuclease [Saprospiraceae bacterium]
MIDVPFQLDRDIVFFDVETTGLHVIRDRILQIAMLRYPHEGGEVRELSLLINPGIPISEEAMGVHGITPADLANKPTFQQVAQKIFDFIGNSDLAGYNSNRFDVPILMEELARYGFDLQIENRRLIDIQRIFYKMEPRTLKAAYQFYCNSELENAHDALSDIRATVEILKGQLQRYKGQDFIDEDGNTTPNPVRNDMQALHDFTNDLRTPDATQKFRYDEQGNIVFNFGKYIGRKADKVLYEDKNYYYWMLEKEFSFQVKNLVKKLAKEYEIQIKQQGSNNNTQ